MRARCLLLELALLDRADDTDCGALTQSQASGNRLMHAGLLMRVTSPISAMRVFDRQEMTGMLEWRWLIVIVTQSCASPSASPEQRPKKGRSRMTIV